MTLKEFNLAEKKRVLNNMELFHSYNYERVIDGKDVFLYKQINPEIGCLILYFCSDRKAYNLHGFDLYICKSKNNKEAVSAYRNATIIKFWIPCFHGENEIHRSCFFELNNENETDIEMINNKYTQKYKYKLNSWKKGFV